METIGVKLIATTKSDIGDIPWLMSYAARTCYEGEEPTGDKLINIKENIFPVRHHTIIQHANFTFFIEGIPIGNITLGLHLAMIFNVSSQRSGRFCFGMFSDPAAINRIMQHIQEFYPETTEVQMKQIQAYLTRCIQAYQNNLAAGTQIAADFIRGERPRATEKYIEQNAKKFAQEQLRVLIPVIFPTAITFTINLSTLAALYRVAWDPVMLNLTEQMVQQVLAVDSSLAYAFQRLEDPLLAHPLRIPPLQEPAIHHHPICEPRSLDSLKHAIYPNNHDTDPVDTLYFNPKFMPNNDINIKTQVAISLATMGQDQRHRRLNRGLPKFIGTFYCPPIASKMGLAEKIEQLGWEWYSLSTTLHPALAQTLAPYGAMVEYSKSGDLNAVLHEQEKRLCWCTQQEIYEISSQLRTKISDHPNCTEELLAHLAPPCYQSGKCGEGRRYCGRDLSIERDRFFPVYRKV